MTTLTPITLSGSISAWTGQNLYGENDGLGLQNQYSTYEITVSSINPQTHGDSSTREPNIYNGLDVSEGGIEHNGGRSESELLGFINKHSN